ncbi:MAG: valine--tRNA ligase [Acidobacteriota bacterium]
MSLDAYFEPQTHEADIYRRWEASGAFQPSDDPARPAFTISMPPPNATGTLHLGHAVMLAIEDVMARWRRMAGDAVLWLPGTDHAAIATESVVIRKLQAEGMPDPRAALGREKLVASIADFVAQSRDRIREQVRAMGASCDWTRERYTMDPQLNRCVNAVFARMFRDGLIYRAPRIVNWDPYLQTTVSDDEIYHEERPATFYTMKYGPFEVGTSRPETKLGDTAIAVHPDDERYRAHIGKTYEVPWPKGPTITIRVVGDPHVDPEFGTGALGVTPAHSHADFDIAQRHNLPLIQIIGEDGRMTEAAGPHYAGMTVAECREAFAAELDAAGLLVEARPYSQSMSLCYRSKKAIEPLPKAQWFIDVNKPAVPWKGKTLSLRQVLRDTVDAGDIEILPEHEAKTYFHWIDNLRDWCISRQIWWGHRVPVWYRGEEDMYVGHRPPSGDPAADGWTQDPDTLDTWFSSALWTWSTLVDPDLAADPARDLRQLLAESPDFARFHPTSVMETGYDILFFWVARMILATTYATGEVPFRTVYLHGLILDKDGDKMSKSKPATCVDPLDTIAEHGADTMRLSLLLGNAPGKDLKLGKERIVGCKRLVNKIWNAAKLVQRTMDGASPADLALPEAIEHPVNRWMLGRMRQLITRIDARLAGYHFGDAAEQIRGDFWSQFCDVYLEAIKVPGLADAAETPAVVSRVFADYLKLFHPFLPFVTEHLWSALGHDGHLITASWPAAEMAHDWPAETAGVDAAARLISAVRALRAEQDLAAAAKIDLAIGVRNRDIGDVLRACGPIIERLTRAEQLVFEDASDDAEAPADAAVTLDADFIAAVRLGAADRAAEHKRLEKQLEAGRKRLAGLDKQLANENFVTRAKPEAVQRVRDEAARQREELEAVEARLATMAG